MNLADVAKTAASVGLTALGTALGGPGGAAVASQVSKWLGLSNANPETINAALTDPKYGVQLKQIEANVQIAQIKAASEGQVAVNQTMQAEAKAEHWPQWLWRPMVGFSLAFNGFCASLLALVTFAPAFVGHAPNAEALKYLPQALLQLAYVNAGLMPVVGVTAWGRNKLKQLREGGNNGTGTQ